MVKICFHLDSDSLPRAHLCTTLGGSEPLSGPQAHESALTANHRFCVLQRVQGPILGACQGPAGEDCQVRICLVLWFQLAFLMSTARVGQIVTLKEPEQLTGKPQFLSVALNVIG